MRSRARSHVGPLAAALATALAGAALLLAPAAHAAFGVALWEAGTCVNPACTYKSVEGNHAEAFTKAAGHPPFGVTTFELNSKETIPTVKEPLGGPLKRVRVDVAKGLASNPQAPPKCAIKAFQKDECPAATQVGENQLTVFAKAADTPVTGPVYNLEPEASEGISGEPLLFGIHVEIPLVANEHVFLRGYVAWWSDYHEYFEIDNISETKAKAEVAPVLRSKLIFKGTNEPTYGNFITLPSECSPTTTNALEIESWSGEVGHETNNTPLGVEACDKVPFGPTVEVKPETAAPDRPDGATTEVKVPQKAGALETNTADVKDAHVTFPEGLTLNSAAARGLQVCTPAQIGIGTTKPVECPAASKIGEVAIEADLPPKSLVGNVYLGAPGGVPIREPPFTIYVDAESAKYGVSVRLQGQASVNKTTGRIETTFLNNPQQPFSDFILKLTGGPQAPLANPLTCGTAQVESTFTPWAQVGAALRSSPFTTSGCSSPLSFALAQSTADQPASAGAFGSTSYTFNLARSDGQQYLSRVSTALPLGLVGAIPAVTQCGEPQAAQGTCSAASQIGTATVTVGAGAEPYPLSGPVYLTGPYGGGPFGLSIPVPAAAGPFNFGTIVTRAAITINPYTGRVSATSGPLTQIVEGVPVRLKSVSVTVNRSNFLYNPTNCGSLSTDSTLTSTFGAMSGASSPFQVGNCGALHFTPSFSVSSDSQTGKLNGASLQVNVSQPAHQANIRSVATSLPIQLPSRLSTLQQACPEATYAANPYSCPAGSNVGAATVTTPVLPGHLSGPAYLVSHGNAAFPDLDLLLEGDGVRVILVGNTDIKRGITTSTFAALPDVPESSFSLTLPTGPHSALTSFGSLCSQPLVMPTTITAQNGAQFKQETVITVAGCAVTYAGANCIRVLQRKLTGQTLKLTVRVCAAGRLSAGGRYLHGASRKLRRAGTATLAVKLSNAGTSALHRHRRLRVRVHVTFVPKKHGERRSLATVTISFRR
jgi:hypothetical protein